MSAADVKPDGPCVLIIFGAGGDLTKRLLVPSLANLARSGLLSAQFRVIAVLHSPKSDDEFRKEIGADLAKFGGGQTPSGAWNEVQSTLRTVAGEFDDPKLYAQIRQVAEEFDRDAGTGGNYLFYQATAPEYFGVIAGNLGSSGLAAEAEGRWRRMIVEKPFGHDLASAQQLNRDLTAVFDEARIYRIDHYLGKETVQNIFVFRFANGMFEPIWNNHFIDNVQITVAEQVGVESRGKFYDRVGALRDMVQNHLFQLVAMTCMEPPSSITADAIRNEKVKVLESILPIEPWAAREVAVRAQYGAGAIQDQPAAPYRAEPNVDPQSRTETFVALKIELDTWRWGGVPFYLRTGKHLAAKTSEIAIQFRRAPQHLFRGTDCEQCEPNWLVIRIQPNEGIAMHFGAKLPGPALQVGAVDMDFSYAQRFGKSNSTGYETLLYDAMLGDPMLFQRADQVEAGWRAVQPILDAWSADSQSTLPTYPSGSWGPKEAEDLLVRDGRAWRPISPPEYS